MVMQLYLGSTCQVTKFCALACLVPTEKLQKQHNKFLT